MQRYRLCGISSRAFRSKGRLVLFLKMDLRAKHVTVKIISHTSMSVRDGHFPNADVAEHVREEFAQGEWYD